MNKRTFLALFLVLSSCSSDPDKVTTNEVSVQPEVIDVVDTTDDTDVEVDLCADVTVSHGGFEWCTCNPYCCDTQTWFCQPEFGQPTLQKKDVVVNFCDENKVRCDPFTTSNCPPPQIIFMGDCYDAYECPPGAQQLDYGWQNCELADGTLGKQNVVCDKGKLFLSDCQPCILEICDGKDNDCDGETDEGIGAELCENECGPGDAVCIDGTMVCFGLQPQEEICDYVDNDCDGEIDEGQRNACDECGSVPAEECNGVDDDCNGATDEDLIQECSTVCENGLMYCVAGNWSGCTAKVPSDEICDGQDNDCDGEIDEDLECLCKLEDVGKLLPCFEEPLLCGQGYKTCLCSDPTCNEILMSSCLSACYWMTDPPGSDPGCDPLTGYPLQKEYCNNFDDNCNELIDEDLIADCYTGPEGTLGVGICKPGNVVCEAGTWGSYSNNVFIADLCADQVLPTEEECNGVDDNCDGITDWDEEINDTDIVFIVDWSGSMQEEITAVLVAMNQFAQFYALEDKIRWGLIIGPKNFGGYFEYLQMVIDVSPLQDFLSAFGGVGDVNSSGSQEMLLDALYFAMRGITTQSPYDMLAGTWQEDIVESDPPKDNFKLSWRPDSDRIIIVISDEKPQSFLNPELTESDIVSACTGAINLKVYALAKYSHWENVANSCGGQKFDLTSSSVDTYNSLMQILDEICKPDA
jgi:hypothetical protein